MSVDKVNDIEVSGLSFSYQQLPVLKDLTFHIRKGSYLGIIGPNGGGKSTLIRLLLGLLDPNKGKIQVLGEDPRKRRVGLAIGYVPQRVAKMRSFFPATVREVVMSGRTAQKRFFSSFREKDHRAVEEALEVMGIVDLADKLMGDLSGGQRQRVFIARALARNPRVLILDEPTVGVDVSTEGDFYACLKRLNEQQGMTIILVTHDLDVVAKEVKRVLCLNTKMVCHTTVKDFMHHNYLDDLYGKEVKLVKHHSH